MGEIQTETELALPSGNSYYRGSLPDSLFVGDLRRQPSVWLNETTVPINKKVDALTFIQINFLG